MQVFPLGFNFPLKYHARGVECVGLYLLVSGVVLESPGINLVRNVLIVSDFSLTEYFTVIHSMNRDNCAV